MRVFLIALLAAISYAQTDEPHATSVEPQEERFYEYGTPDTADDCPDGYVQISDERECAEASVVLGAVYAGESRDGQFWPVPQYCIADSSESGTRVYYNNHAEGSPVAHRRPVCIQRRAVTSEAPSASTTGMPSVLPTMNPSPIPYRVFVKFISSYGCSINQPRIAAMEWNFYDHINATEEIASEYFNFTGALESPENEMPHNLADDDVNTKWLSFLECNDGEGEECACTNEIQLQFTLMEMPKYYTFVSGDHGQLRDPAIWDISFCCAEGSTVDNPHGCGPTERVNVFEEPHSSIYGPNLGRLEETGKFPIGTCEMGPSIAPTIFTSPDPSKTPTRSPFTSTPSMAPFTPSEQPSASPVYQDYFEWNCTNVDEPTSCEEYTRGLTQECEVAPAPHNDTNDYCCSVSDGSYYCCDTYDPSDPNNIWVGQDVARCTHVDSLCIQTCFKANSDGTQRTCHKMCPDAPTIHPSTNPTALCEDQDEVYSMNGTTYWDEASNKTMTCEQVIQILFVNNGLNCTNHFARQCPVACDSCTQIPTANPTANPSRPPQEPSVFPTYGPSKPPHPQCADDDPVIIGGIELSGNCTELTKQLLQGAACSDSLARVCEKSCPNACTDYPTLFPIVSPTVSPSTRPSRGPTSAIPTTNPSGTPSKTPSKTPTAQPSQPPNLDCVDVDEVTSFGGQPLGFGISCEVAVQVVFDNDDTCQGDLLRQCPDSCGTCTDEPSKSPSSAPTISCYDRYPVYDAEGQELPNLECSEIVFVLSEQFGPENPCTPHYAEQCPFSCGLCTPIPSTTPTSSYPSATPSLSIPTSAPTLNTTFVPTVTQLPSAEPTHAGPYQCGESMAECDVGFTTLFAALILCQNQAYEDCPSVFDTTACPEVDCPSTECPDVVCPDCPYTNGGSTNGDDCTTTVESVITYDVTESCQTATGSWVGQVIEGLAGFDRDTMTLCESDGEYKVAYNNRVYPTCVAYGAPSSLCTDDNLICPEWRDEGVFGFAGNQRGALAAAFLRNDFRHQDCPTIQEECEPLEAINEGYWKDLFVQRTGLDISYAQNLCVNTATSEVRYVSENAYMNTCVGFSNDAIEACPTSRTFICRGDYQGFVTYGWPGQIMEALGRAVEQTNSKRHPSCPF